MEVGGVTAEGLDRGHGTHAGVAIVDCLAHQRLDDQVEAENWDCTNSLLRAPRYSRATKEPETVDFRGNVCQQDTIGRTIVASVDG